MKSVQAYIKNVVTDDDSTTRANLRHSIKDRLNMKYGKDLWKKSEVWPKVDGKDIPDKGLLPLDIPEISQYYCDISHRCKVIGGAMYKIKSGFDPRPTELQFTKYSNKSKDKKENISMI